jgi:hypothetical protein
LTSSDNNRPDDLCAVTDREDIARVLFNQRQTGHDFDDAADADAESDAGTLRSIVFDDADAIIALARKPAPVERVTNGQQYEADYTPGADKAREIVSWINSGETRNRAYRMIRDALNATTDQSAEIARLRAALEAAAGEFDLILSRLKDGQDERAAGAAICGAKDARAALNTKDADR